MSRTGNSGFVQWGIGTVRVGSTVSWVDLRASHLERNRTIIPDTREGRQQQFREYQILIEQESRLSAVLTMSAVKTDVNPSDIGTKALGRERFYKMRSSFSSTSSWSSLHRVRSSSLRPRRNRRPPAVRRESRSSVCVNNSEPGTIFGASTSKSVKYVGTVLPLCPLVPGRISGPVQPHQCSHDVFIFVTTTCPHHHLVVTAFSKFRVSECRGTLDLRVATSPEHSPIVGSFLRAGTSQHRSSSSTIKSTPSPCTNASSMTTSAAVRLSRELSQKPSTLPVLLQR